MDFSFSEEQRMLRESMRKALTTPAFQRQRQGSEDSEVGREAWRLASGLGWPALHVPEAEGGLGMGPVESVIAAEEMGRALFAGSFRDSAVLLPALLAMPGAEAFAPLYPALCEGQLHLALAWHEAPEGNETGSTCTLRDGKLYGRKFLVEHAHAATHLLVIFPAQAGEDCWTACIVANGETGMSLVRRQSLDITCGLADVVFNGCPVLGEASLRASSDRLFAASRLFNCAEQNGVAEATLQMSLAYVRERKQFGQPVGSFQAVKHRLSDAFVLVENAKSATYYAAIALQDQLPDCDFALHCAQALASEAAVRVTSDCLQVHGGVGFTWEYDLHLFFKRARRLATFMGGAEQAYQAIEACRVS